MRSTFNWFALGMLIAIILFGPCGCVHTGKESLQRQIILSAVDCYGGQPAHGGMRVQRYGDVAQCPKRSWLEREWELLQKRVRIDDDLAISEITLIYTSGVRPCSPARLTTDPPKGCAKLVDEDDFVLFVDQDETVLGLDLKRHPTWPRTTFHEICHGLQAYYGHDHTHSTRWKAIRDGPVTRLVEVYSKADRYFYQTVCKAIGGDKPRLRYPLSKKDPLRLGRPEKDD